MWVQDPLGGSGKSTFLRYLSRKAFGKLAGYISKNAIEGFGVKLPAGITLEVAKIVTHSAITALKNPTKIMESKDCNINGNQAKYYRNRLHIGSENTKIYHLQSTYRYSKEVKKKTRDSSEEYQGNRSCLNEESGFNERRISILTTLSITSSQLVEIIEGKKDHNCERIKQALESTEGIGTTIACIGGTKKRLTVRNFMQGYRCHIVIRIFKINNSAIGIKELMTKITHNKEYCENTRDKSLHNAFTMVYNLIESNIKFKEKGINLLDAQAMKDLVDNKGVDEIYEAIEELMKKKESRRSSKRVDVNGDEIGKIRENDQYTDPILNDPFKITFTASPRTKLSDSQYFSRNTTQVKKIVKTLEPSDTWELTIDQHYGDGICLDTLFDNYQTNPDYVEDYVIAIETIGDKRGSVKKSGSKGFNEVYMGVSPAMAHTEFEQSMYYTEEKRRSKGKEVIIYNKEKQNNELDVQYDLEKQISETYYPVGENKKHIPSENIFKSTDMDLSESEIKQKEYKLIYDNNVVTGPTIVEEIKKLAKELGEEPDNFDENDAAFLSKTKKNLRGEEHGQPPSPDPNENETNLNRGPTP